MPIYDYVAEADSFTLRRDATPLKTPAGALYGVPTRALAESMAEEWRVQGDKPDPAKMPLTQLAATALDVIGAKRDEVIASLAAYAECDLLCHRADQPPELAERQTQVWQPWLDWAVKRFGAELRVGQGIMPIAQPKEAGAALRGAIAAFDVFRLAGLQQAVGASGSLVLGLALLEAQATATQVFEAAELDSLFQMEKWGEDPVTAERHNSARRELELCKKWFGMLEI
jgi:chaperone required for assembly of F1-ATPase